MPKYKLISEMNVHMECTIEADNYEEAYKIGAENTDPKTGQSLEWDGDLLSLENDWSFFDAFECDDEDKEEE